MASMYPRRGSPGFGNRKGLPSPLGPARPKPLKRPLQARAKFTVQAIYDAFVRIWRTHGWDGITTRAVALETGVSVGTLYEYFPNKHALLSGYVRHCVDILVEEIERQVIQPEKLDWRERICQLVRLTCGVRAQELPYFDSVMLTLEYQIAEPKHHRRVYEELSALWIKAYAKCSDAPSRPTADEIRSLYLSVWGGRRYLLLVQPTDISASAWEKDMQRLCLFALMPTSSKC